MSWLVYFWLAVLSVEIFFFCFCRVAAKKVIKRLAGLYDGLFFHGLPINKTQDSYFFARLSAYVRNGLCYESAALTMLALRRERKSRLVIARAFSKREKRHCLHAWVEVKMYGIWWAIDYTWRLGTVLPSVLNNISSRVKYLRIVTYDEFWEIPLAGQYHEAISKADTSSIFWYLSAFCPCNDNPAIFMFEKADCFNLNQGEYRIPVHLLNLHGKPVTQRMIRTFLIRPRRCHPKQKDLRRAKILIKTFNRMRIEYLEKLKDGKKATVYFNSIKDYTITIHD